MGGPLSYEQIVEMIDERETYLNIKNFVESGTYHGDTTLMASEHYDNVYTTEIMENLHEYSKDRAQEAGKTNIHFYLGDTVELMKEITPNVLDGAVFFIDAHISGPDSGWNGTQRVPVFEELDIILSHRDLGASLFIIDDMRFTKDHEKEAWDWAHISTEKVLNLFRNYGFQIALCKEEHDRLWIFTK